MNCVNSHTEDPGTTLLTQTDKVVSLDKLFAKYRHTHDVFLPDETFYKAVTGPEDVEHMAGSIFKWLGIKHRSITFHIDPSQDQLVTVDVHKTSTRVVVGWVNQIDPFICGASVAHAIVHHLLICRAKLDLGNDQENEELADLGTIYLGLGIVVMNGFGSRTSVLGSMARTNYVAECLDYFKDRNVVPSLWQPYVIPSVIAQNTRNHLPDNQYVPYIRTQRTTHQTHKKRLVIIGSMALVMTGLLVAVFATKPRYLSAEMQDQKESINLLKDQHKQCQDTVLRKRQTWDQSDIFILRQIEADQTRCTSLKNRYNYEVGQFNSRL
ncbi:hypothetical protein H0X10_00090 [Candidatus Saccharibacteria bacterium]|nr:hypothetical protein [Candidatus Saccharibacteria bacterium]